MKKGLEKNINTYWSVFHLGQIFILYKCSFWWA